jgi:formylglycine-generating enzyme required for sulfatase activity
MLWVGRRLFALRRIEADQRQNEASLREQLAVANEVASVDCPDSMLKVPAGWFTMGSLDGNSDERPQHRVWLDTYCIHRTPVTVAQFRAWPGSTNPPPNSDGACNWSRTDLDNHPINCVDWNQARTYCQAHGWDLPTEAQREKAARGAEGRKHPWGEVPPRDQLCWRGRPRGQRLGVGARLVRPIHE